MTSMKLKLTLGFTALIFVMAVVICVRYYSYVFAKTVTGEVIGIERVSQANTIIGGGGTGAPIPPAQIFSFAVAIKNEKSEIFTASSEDRQWAVVQKGHCAEAKFLPYPPWQFDKAGTFFGARLVRLFECKK